ncbi:MAG: tetratricopeptide repeat protein [Bdellovibrionota bacterium]
MLRIGTFAFKLISMAFFASCATSSHQFFDSAMNDRNRAPASLGVPNSFDLDQDDTDKSSTSDSIIDPMHNQAHADYLFLKSEMESNAGRNTGSVELLKNILVYDPSAATVMQRLAVEYYKSAKMSDAMYWAERAKAVSPERRDLNLLLAGLHTAAKNYAKAEALYKRLVKMDDEDTESLLYLGAVYTEQKNYPKATAVFQTLGKHSGYSAKYLAHYYLARVYSEQSKANFNKVKDELKIAIKLKPDFLEAVNMLGHLIEKKEGKDKAYAFYADHQEKHGPNSKLAELLSQYYIAKNDLDKAYVQLEILDEASEDLVQVKLKMSLILIEKKFYDKAVIKLREILVLAPEADKVRFYLAAVFEETKDYKNALMEYLRVEKSSSYFEESRLHAAFLAKLMGNVDQAISVLKESIDKKIENPSSYFLMSQLFEEKKDTKKALEILISAKDRFPKNSQVYYYLGTLQDKLNFKTDMLENMKKVVELEPGHAQALNYLAYSWAESGQYLDLAENYARKAVEKEKEDAFILDTLGWVLFKKGKYKEAVQALDKAHAMQPTASIISEHLGDIYTKMNLHNKARREFIKAVETESDSDRKKEIKSKLTYIEDKLKNSRTPSSLAPGSNTDEYP